MGLSGKESENSKGVGSASAGEPYREIIELGLSRDRNAMAIWQDLVSDYGFQGGYPSIRRYAYKLRGAQLPQARAVILTAQEKTAKSITAAGRWCANRKAASIDAPVCSCSRWAIVAKRYGCWFSDPARASGPSSTRRPFAD
jgi:hypothetical protein